MTKSQTIQEQLAHIDSLKSTSVMLSYGLYSKMQSIVGIRQRLTTLLTEYSGKISTEYLSMMDKNGKEIQLREYAAAAMSEREHSLTQLAERESSADVQSEEMEQERNNKVIALFTEKINIKNSKTEAWNIIHDSYSLLERELEKEVEHIKAQENQEDVSIFDKIEKLDTSKPVQRDIEYGRNN